MVKIPGLNRQRAAYGGFGVIMLLTRLAILICAAILTGMSATGISTTPSGKKYDPLEVFGTILGASTLLHSLLAFFPASKVAKLRRMFEAGICLIVLHATFIIGVRLTPGQMPANYVALGPRNKNSRMWSAFIAAICSGIFLLPATLLDFLRRNDNAYGDEAIKYPDVESQ